MLHMGHDGYLVSTLTVAAISFEDAYQFISHTFANYQAAAKSMNDLKLKVEKEVFLYVCAVGLSQ